MKLKKKKRNVSPESPSSLTSKSLKEDRKLRFWGKKNRFWKLENTINNCINILAKISLYIIDN